MTNTKQLRKDIEVLRRAILPDADAARSKQIRLLLKAYELLTHGEVERGRKVWQMYEANEPPCSMENDALYPKYEEAVRRAARRNMQQGDTVP